MNSRRVLPAKSRRERLELLLRVPVPAAGAPARDHGALCVLPRSRRRRRRSQRPGRRAKPSSPGGAARSTGCSAASAQHPVTRALQPSRSGRSEFHERASDCRFSTACRWTCSRIAISTSRALQRYAISSRASSANCRRESSAYREPQTLQYARRLGLALQLTNIIRDVGEDARRGRDLSAARRDAALRASRRPTCCTRATSMGLRR